MASLNHGRVRRSRALEQMIADYSGRTGQRYPTYLMLSKFLDEREAGRAGAGREHA